KRARSIAQPVTPTASATITPARRMRRRGYTHRQHTIGWHVGTVVAGTPDLKHLLKRGALVAAANWPVVVIQFIAQTTFQVLLALRMAGAAILVTVLLGTDLADILQGSLRDIFTAIASTLLSEPLALVAFVTAFAIVLLGGSVL